MKSPRPPTDPAPTPLGSSLGLRIVVVGSDMALAEPGDDHALEVAERGRQLRIGLLQNGYNVVAVLPADAFLDSRLAQLQPDLIIVDAESDARDALEHVVMATREARRPIVLFTEDEDTTHVRDAVAAGVSAYIVAGLAPERIRPILEVAVARFDHEQGLRAELDKARTELSERRTIERAKAILAERHQLTEPQAHERLRRAAMDRGLRLADVAQRIVDVSDLL